MTDPRNIAHDKKVQQEKKHKHGEIAPGAQESVQPGRKPQMAPRPPEPVQQPNVTDLPGAAPGEKPAS